MRGGTAKLLTLFQPQSGNLRVKGVRQSTNAVLHPWLKQELKAILAQLPAAEQQAALDPELNRALWQHWQQGLDVKFSRSGLASFKNAAHLG